MSGDSKDIFSLLYHNKYRKMLLGPSVLTERVGLEEKQGKLNTFFPQEATVLTERNATSLSDNCSVPDISRHVRAKVFKGIPTWMVASPSKTQYFITLGDINL